MCGGPQKPSRSTSAMSESKPSAAEGAGAGGDAEGAALLLELAASDDVAGFRRAVEEEGLPLDVAAPWYGRSFSGGGRMRMGVEQRTPLMIAALYGGAAVLGYILSVAPGEALRRSPSDGATALHLAASGGSPSSPDIVRALLSSYSADPDALDLSGRRPGDLIPRPLPLPLSPNSNPGSLLHHNLLLLLLKSPSPSPSPSPMAIAKASSSPPTPKKEYPPDLTLPDIKNGIYSTDEFRMYAFKVKPCSRAYSHDWTECPFVHPGENARRRDPRKFLYSCVPCPEFRKGSCRHGDACEYAHGVFESWLHPAQYRTRLCKDETGCARRVCFFAHKPDELRSVNPSLASVSAGLALPSPRSSNDAAAAALILLQQQQQQQQSSSPSSCWMDQQPLTPPPPAALQLPASRLKASLSARDLDFELDLLGLEGYQQKLLDELSSNSISNPSGSPRTPWPAANLLDPLVLSQMMMIQHQQQQQPQLLSGGGFGSNLPSPSPPAPDHSMAKAIMNSRASAFAKRSYSFCDRGAPAASPARASSTLSLSLSPSAPAPAPASLLSDWGSPGGKLDWGIQGEELSKLRKSASFGFRTSQSPPVPAPAASAAARFSSGSKSAHAEPDLSWVQSLVKDAPAPPVSRLGQLDYFHASDLSAPWPDHEQIVA